MGLSRLPYHWMAERYPARRDRILLYWVRTDRRATRRLHDYRERQQAVSSTGIPASVRATLLCIHPYEEPSWSTSAGGLGFVYSPASYGGVAAQLAQTYGNTWYGWPVEAQLQVGAMLVAKYGYSPWTTAYHCT
jgi:hypothetical protein